MDDLNTVIGFSIEQWYCNACQRSHYGDEKCPCQIENKKREETP